MPKTRLQYNISKLFEKINLQELAEDLSPYLDLGGGGTGDMTKAVYDTNDDGIVDAATTATTATTADATEALIETSGPTTLTMGAIAVNEFLKRVGTTIVGATPAGSGDMTAAVYDPSAIASDAFDYNNFINTPSIPTQYTDELAQDAVGTILTDTATIDFTYTDATPKIEASVKTASITEAMQVLADNTTNDVSTSAHGYVPKAPNDTTKYLRGDASWATVSAGSESYTHVYKTSDESTSSNNTLSDDSALTCSFTSGHSYVFAIRALVRFDADADFKFDVNFTGTTSLVNLLISDFQSTTSANGNTMYRGANAFGTDYVVAQTGSAEFFAQIIIDGFCTVTGDGTLNFRWAQNTSSGDAVYVLAGSWLRYHEI